MTIQPVAGEVIGRSTGKSIGMMLLGVLGALFGAFLLWAYATGAVLDPSSPTPQKVTTWGLIVGLVLLVGGPLVAVYMSYLLKIKRRIILGRDRLQIVQKVEGSDAAIIQIPYRCIEHVEIAETAGGKEVAIRLHTLHDPEFAQPVPGEFENRMSAEGFHYSIGGGYLLAVPMIYQRLLGALQSAPR